jgi:hypothetical protein
MNPSVSSMLADEASLSEHEGGLIGEELFGGLLP